MFLVKYCTFGKLVYREGVLPGSFTGEKKLSLAAESATIYSSQKKSVCTYFRVSGRSMVSTELLCIHAKLDEKRSGNPRGNPRCPDPAQIQKVRGTLMDIDNSIQNPYSPQAPLFWEIHLETLNSKNSYLFFKFE